ncbi:cell division control protein 31 [Lodderomyces elongisporus NRRL YB-4239]|uniref:Cell division control protein 31 n=1 Tax=Lodderomyces elongisporus (strain ATCC 11503 / CBS 2605 / JCM 1781 / NBRC 1676 / NRRL YB-4239) TaxID=379508 RepID=A5E173_LODEL|nr:cell division control protein 31 [Lodderomyces elongisporus NRRL YB-4239]
MFNRGERITSLGGGVGGSGGNGNANSSVTRNFSGTNNHINSNNNVKQELAEEQKSEIREAFQLFDMDGDGQLDYHETKVAFRALGFDLSKREVLDIIREYDLNDSHRLSYENFFKVVGEMILKRDPLEEIRRAFQLFDTEGTGLISVRSLKKISRDLGENLSDEELKAMIEEFDLDEDGGSMYIRIIKFFGATNISF